MSAAEGLPADWFDADENFRLGCVELAARFQQHNDGPVGTAREIAEFIRPGSTKQAAAG